MTDRSEWLAERGEEAADVALGSATIARKAAAKVVDVLPTRDPRDNVNYPRVEAARKAPPCRGRWESRPRTRRRGVPTGNHTRPVGTSATPKATQGTPGQGARLPLVSRCCCGRVVALRSVAFRLGQPLGGLRFLLPMASR